MQWRGSDRDGDGDGDGDRLTYTVRASADGAETWKVLALNTTDTRLALDAETLAGLPGGAAQVQVLVTDGVRSGVAQAGPFTVPSQPPQAAILAADREGDYVVLSGFAADLEDGTLNEFYWSSNVDGRLGTGNRLRIRAADLTPGEHRITLTARDSAGGVGTDAVAMVSKSPVPQPRVRHCVGAALGHPQTPTQRLARCLAGTPWQRPGPRVRVRSTVSA